MAQPVIQPSFNSGEWAPHLYGRVDLEKFHSGAALLRNFFVDYRGGASTRVGTKYIIRGYKDSSTIRMIPFQSSFSLGFAMEFGHRYIRFYQEGAPVLEAPIAITGATKANPCVLTAANSYTTGDVDWVYIEGVNGMTQLNGKFYIVHARDATHITLYDLFGNPVDSTGYGTYTSAGTVQRIYTLATPYDHDDLALLKFVQNGNVMILCHPDYVPYELTAIAANNWTIAAITFGTTATAPTPVIATTTLGPGTVFYSYVVTSIDENGQESLISAAGTLDNVQDLRTVAGTNFIAWGAVSGAQSYNVYKAEVSYQIPVPTGTQYGFIGNTTGTRFADSNIAQDYSQSPPVPRNPFDAGSGISFVQITVTGSYTVAPTVTFGAPPAPGITAVGHPLLGILSVASIAAAGAGYAINDTINLGNGGATLLVTNVAAGAITAVSVLLAGQVATIPANPVSQVSTSGAGTGAQFTLNWQVREIVITTAGSNYAAPPAVTFSAGAAAGTAFLGPSGLGNPSVPAFFQQRLVLAAPTTNPQTLFMSRPGLFYNFNVSEPVQDDDAITATLVSGQLNNIKSLIAQSGGLIVLTDNVSFLINGGSLGSPVTPATATANTQSFVGANDIPPVVSNFDILFAKSKGTGVQDSTYNFYANVFTGSDITLIASHLFYGYKLTEWCWAEEPYKTIQAVRNDGTLLTLTFIKEQEFTAWTHSDTDGLFKSVCTIVEPATVGFQNYVYTVVLRSINNVTVQYIEMFPERLFTNGVEDAWTVDCGLQYDGSPATSFSGGEHLVGKTCTGLADGEIITPFVMPASGNFTLPSSSKVTVGLAYTCDLQTLYLDTGEPTIQSKMKKLPAETIRVTETLGLKIGTDFDNLVDMKDLVVGNVGSMTNEVVTNLVTGDARTYLDPKWQEEGTICIRQELPYPASILAVFPQLTVGDTPK